MMLQPPTELAHLSHRRRDVTQPDETHPIQCSPDPSHHSPLKWTARQTSYFYLAMASLCIIALMAALDATSIAIAIPTITTDRGGTAVEGFWSGTGFLLPCTVFQPVLGSLSDIFGRKPALSASLILFAIGAVMAAVARDMTVLLAGRAVQGVGGGGIVVLAEIVITDVIELRRRGNYFAALAAMWALGSVAGPVVGGAFAETDWRWIFWINLPFICVSTPPMLYFLRLKKKESRLLDKLRKIDWIGGCLFIASTTGFLIPITWGGINYPWNSWDTLAPLVASSIGIIAFILWELLVAEDPLIRLRVLKGRTAGVTFLGDFLHGLVMWCSLFYQPLYFQAVKRHGPIHSGIDLFPTSFATAPAAIVVGAVVTKLGAYRWSIWIGWYLATLGFGLMILFDVRTSTACWVGVTLIMGFGTGMLATGLMFAVQAATPAADQAYAVSLFTFFRAAGQCVGVAVGGAIFQNGIKHQISTHASIAAHAQEWSKDATAVVELLKFMPNGEGKTDLIQSYADALKYVWILACALSGIGLLSSLWTQHFSLDMVLATDQGFEHRSVGNKGYDRVNGGGEAGIDHHS